MQSDRNAGTIQHLVQDDKNKDRDDNTCRSDKLATGIFAQVNQDSLLVLRAEPFTGSVNGRAGSMSTVKVLAGPVCAEGAVWWKVNALGLGIVGWAAENELQPCPKDSECNLESS